MVQCPICGQHVADLSKHAAHSARCASLVPKEEAPAQRRKHEPLDLTFFRHKFARRVVTDYNELRYAGFVSGAANDAWHSCALGWIDEIGRAMRF